MNSPSGHISEERTDRRTQRTRELLHQAQGSLIREKSVRPHYRRRDPRWRRDQSLELYIHFLEKDDLLTSTMCAFLLGVLSMEVRATADGAEQMVAFSLPLVTSSSTSALPKQDRVSVAEPYCTSIFAQNGSFKL